MSFVVNPKFEPLVEKLGDQILEGPNGLKDIFAAIFGDEESMVRALSTSQFHGVKKAAMAGARTAYRELQLVLRDHRSMLHKRKKKSAANRNRPS